MTRLNVSRRTLGRMMADGEIAFTKGRVGVRIGETQCDRILLGTSKGSSAPETIIRVSPAVGIELRPSVQVVLRGVHDALRALEDLGALTLDEGEIRITIALARQIIERVTAQCNLVRIVFPQDLSDLNGVASGELAEPPDDSIAEPRLKFERG